MGEGVITGAVGAMSLLSSLTLLSLFAELDALFSLFAELVVLILTLTSPVGLFFLQVVNLIPILARRMKAMAPPALMRGILRFDGLSRVGRAGKLLAVTFTVMLLLKNSVWLMLLAFSSQFVLVLSCDGQENVSPLSH